MCDDMCKCIIAYSSVPSKKVIRQSTLNIYTIFCRSEYSRDIPIAVCVCSGDVFSCVMWNWYQNNWTEAANKRK